ncbi:MAG TPA: CAP domain-containing protein [Micromonosporaceae bacterium]
MRPRIRFVLGAALILSLTGGGLAAAKLTGPHSGSAGWLSGTRDAAGGLETGTALVAVQAPATPSPHRVNPSTSPSASNSPKPSAAATSKRPSPKPTPKPTKTTPKAPPAGSSVVDQLLAQINQLRADHGLPPYTLLNGLEASAHKHNLLMMGSCGMSHQCPGEASLGDRISAQGVHWTSCGENIGYSGPHPNTDAAKISAAEGLTTAMYNEKPPDDGHRLNLLSKSFHHIGIDVVRASNGTVWLTQDFSS